MCPTVKVSIEEMTRAEFKEIQGKIEVAVVPVGSTEQHGPHLPMCQDTASVLYVAKGAAERLYPKVVLAPPLPYGFSPYHMDYPGTLTISPETFMNVVFEVCVSLKRHGIRKVIILNGHGGNFPAIRLVGYRVRDELGMKVAAFTYDNILPHRIASEVLKEKVDRATGMGGVPGHAGEFETSTALVIHPQLVRRDLIPKGARTPPAFLRYMILDIHEFRPDGVNIDASLGTREKGKILLDAIIDELEKYLKSFAGLP